MNRRDFLRTAGGATAVTASVAAAGVSAAQEGGNETAANNTTATPTGNATNETATPESGGGGGTTKEVTVGPGGSLTFDPEKVYVKPGDTVKWVWDSDDHNIVVGEQPEGADWQGSPGDASTLYDSGYEYSHTFQKKGKYHYWCQPHKTAGMIGDVIVNETGKAPGAGKGGGEKDPKHMGVPIQAHYVGLATILAIFVSLVFTFFQLKYGESPHASGGN